MTQTPKTTKAFRLHEVSRKLLLLGLFIYLPFMSKGIDITTNTTWDLATLDAIFDVPNPPTWGGFSGYPTNPATDPFLILYESITIKAGVTLTIDGRNPADPCNPILLVPFQILIQDISTGIYVEMGAKLIIESTDILPLNQWDHWQGIQALGASFVIPMPFPVPPQTVYFDQYAANNIPAHYESHFAGQQYHNNQTQVHLNKTNISYALTAVDLIDGAIGTFNSCEFRSNKVDVNIQSYKQPNYPYRNATYFNHCHFSKNIPDVFSPTFAGHHSILMNNVAGVYIEGCIFYMNTDPLSSAITPTTCGEYTSAIKATNSIFSVRHGGVPTEHPTSKCIIYEPEITDCGSKYRGSNFTGWSIGIHHVDDGTSADFSGETSLCIDGGKNAQGTNLLGVRFEDCENGIILDGVNRFAMNNSRIDMSQVDVRLDPNGTPCVDTYKGIGMTDVQEFVINNNEFIIMRALDTKPRDVEFIVSDNAGYGKTNLIIANNFTTNQPFPVTPSKVHGIVLKNNNDKIYVQCNVFNEIRIAILIDASSTGKIHQNWTDYRNGNGVENKFNRITPGYMDLINSSSTSITYKTFVTAQANINRSGSFIFLDGTENPCPEITSCEAWPVVDDPTGMEDIDILELQIFPNPASPTSTFTLRNLQNTEFINIEVYTITGQKVELLRNDAESNTFAFVNVKKGLYLVRAIDQTGNHFSGILSIVNE